VYNLWVDRDTIGALDCSLCRACHYPQYVRYLNKLVNDADISVGIYDLSSLFRLPFRMLWFPRFLSRGSHVISTYLTRIIIPLIHQSSKPSTSLGLS